MGDTHTHTDTLWCCEKIHQYIGIFLGGLQKNAKEGFVVCTYAATTHKGWHGHGSTFLAFQHGEENVVHKVLHPLCQVGMRWHDVSATSNHLYGMESLVCVREIRVRTPGMHLVLSLSYSLTHSFLGSLCDRKQGHCRCPTVSNIKKVIFIFSFFINGTQQMWHCEGWNLSETIIKLSWVPVLI